MADQEVPVGADDEHTTLRQLLHRLTEDHLDLDQPVTISLMERGPDGALRWVDMEVTGVISRLGAEGKPVQELEIRRVGQE